MYQHMGIVLGVLLLITHTLWAGPQLVGAGATFPYPLYTSMFGDYTAETGVPVNYQAIGSGGGVKQIRSKTVDFGATDAYVSNKELKTFSSPLLHIPTCLGAVVVVVNLPHRPRLVLNGVTLANIYLGRITRWNDPRIQQLNPTIRLPHWPIAVIHRADGSGTTHGFVSFLAAHSRDWKQKVGVGKAVNWPIGLGGKGNPGVAALVSQIPGSIGYTELVYTLQSTLHVIAIQNKSGRAIMPSLASVTAAIPKTFPADFRLSMIDTPQPNGYPISTFTWLLVYQEQHDTQRSLEQAQELVRLLKWTVTNAPIYTQRLGYASLPPDMTQAVLARIARITYQGRPIQ
ncbi:phosphate ABC transporter substrate-binding protein PstS [bacterium]|nr:phosphate ABC transporter substrate-binding protein PstS [bacterium]